MQKLESNCGHECCYDGKWKPVRWSNKCNVDGGGVKVVDSHGYLRVQSLQRLRAGCGKRQVTKGEARKVAG